MATFSSESRNRLATCHPRLVTLFELVVQDFDCTILEGKRTRDQQAENVRRGVSKTMDSRHLDEPVARAVDVAPYPLKWPKRPAADATPAELLAWAKDLARYYLFAGYVLGRAGNLGIPLHWGGDWDRDWDVHENNFDDLVHFELPKGEW